MTPLIVSASSATFQATRPSVPPSSFRMRRVSVIPPEEGQRDNPPRCCSDADYQLENNGNISPPPDIHFLGVSYPFLPSENDVPVSLSRRASVHQPRSRAPLSKKLEKKQRPEAVKIIENKSSYSRQRDSLEDLDVVEVIKVKRVRETSMDLEENKKAKRPRTLKARATKALQSIKNVGTTSHRTHVKELWTSSQSMPGIVKGMQEQICSPPEDRPLSTHPSQGRSLSQIFQPIEPSRVQSPFTLRVPSAEASHTFPAANPPSLSSPRDNNPTTLMINDSSNGPISRLPPTKRNNTLTKFSALDLHRFFFFSSSGLDDPSSSTAAAGPSLSAPNNSKQSTSPSILSQDYPMEDDIFADAHFVDFESPDRRAASRYHRAPHTRS